MTERGTRGTYRKEDRVQLPHELQKELIEKAAAKFGNCQELAKYLGIPKSSVHYYRIGRLTVPASILSKILDIADDDNLRNRVGEESTIKNRTWANSYAQGFYREMCRKRVVLPTHRELVENSKLRRKAASIVSYMLAEGSIWLQKAKWGELAANITFADHEIDLYDHFRELCRDTFHYDIGQFQKPENNSRAIRGFICSRFVVEWLVTNCVPVGDKAKARSRFPDWVMRSDDEHTWIAALQPLCDGEGSVSFSSRTGLNPFSISQSRHTDLDFEVLQAGQIPTCNWRILGLGELHRRTTYGIAAIDYLTMAARSELLDDALVLFRRLRLEPNLGIASVYLKDDGFWSCIWKMILPKRDVRQLLRLGLVRQELKRYGLQLGML
ncbi:MAG: hypothetical protein ACUVT7_05900 [Thermoplasmata archaeon]